MTKGDLISKTCAPCQGGIAALSDAQARDLAGQLHADWRLEAAPARLVRRLEFKGFAKAVYTANLAAYLGDREGHHPDISFGWGYCEVVFTTHDVGGLSENDFICAARFDRLLAAA